VLWLAADLHLSAHTPATLAAFVRFLRVATTQANAVFLCGDLFDAWVGDDAARHQPEPWLAQLVQALQETSARIPVWWMHGNRDFLLGSSFARLTGTRQLPDPVILHTDAGAILLSHGDIYCTDDRSYQRLRRIVRNRTVQALYLALPLTLRQRIAAWARQRSGAAQRHKTVEILDVNGDAIASALRASATSMLIHGHTHRPAHHVIAVDGHPRARFVLSDWDLDHTTPGRMAWLRVDAQGVQTISGGAPS